MAELFALTPATEPVLPVDPDLVARLETLVEMAKAGEIQGIAYATVQSVGAGSYNHVGSGWVGRGASQNVHPMLGAIVVLQSRLLASEAAGKEW